MKLYQAYWPFIAWGAFLALAGVAMLNSLPGDVTPRWAQNAANAYMLIIGGSLVAGVGYVGSEISYRLAQIAEQVTFLRREVARKEGEDRH